VLMVPGTGELASKFFEPNLGKLAQGNKWNVCYLDVPNDSVGDMQVNAEYVAFAIGSLFRSTNSKIRIVAHSQGCTNVQWALTFWPSGRTKVASFVAMGPAWEGTTISGLINHIRAALANGKEVASVVQQTTGSKFLEALKKHGGLEMHVPTTSIMTNTDEIVIPYSSGEKLKGATNIVVQKICSKTGFKGIVDHFTLVTNSISQFAMLDAFASKNGMADLEAIEKDKTNLCADPALWTRFTRIVGLVVTFAPKMVKSVKETVFTGDGKATIVTAEPPLKPYAAK
ncbi:alpha/beta-hydrolase, partial [Gymnopus androsaceus JB14]